MSPSVSAIDSVAIAPCSGSITPSISSRCSRAVGEDAVADRRVGVVGDDGTDAAEHEGRGDQRDSVLGCHGGDGMPFQALAGGRPEDVVAVDDRARAGEGLGRRDARHEAVELVREAPDEDSMATAHLTPSLATHESRAPRQFDTGGATLE